MTAAKTNMRAVSLMTKGTFAMTKVEDPSKDEWMEDTSDLLAEHEKQITTHQPDGSEIRRRRLEVDPEIRHTIRHTIEQRSKGQKTSFISGGTRLSRAKPGTRNMKNDCPHLQPVWED
jgi:hypothetical protein